jgi:hypothetical protein
MKITTDLVAVGGLAVALVAGVFMGAPSELMTGIAGGLSGYLSKTAITHYEELRKEGDS